MVILFQLPPTPFLVLILVSCGGKLFFSREIKKYMEDELWISKNIDRCGVNFLWDCNFVGKAVF